MDRYERNIEEYYEAGKGGLQPRLQEALAQAPWWMMSAAAHGVMLGILMLLNWTTYTQEKPASVEVGVAEDFVDPLKEEPEKSLFEDDIPLDPTLPPIDNAFVSDLPVEDHPESEDNQDSEGIQGIEDAVGDQMLDGKQTNSAIGVGPGKAGKFGHRFGGRKNLGCIGGGRHTEASVGLGLVWLVNHQNPDGMWSCKRFNMNCRSGTCSGPGSSEEYDTGVTGLSLLAFLGAGHTHRHGKHKEVVKKAVKALVDRQTPDGCVGSKSSDGHWIYNHAICTMALAEAYGMTKSPLLAGPAQKAVDFLVECRNEGLAWRYGRQPGDNDSSVTGWAVLALKSAKMADLTVPQAAFDGALKWFDKVTEPSYYKTGYCARGDSGARLLGAQGKFQPSEAMTAAALTSRIFILGEKATNRPEVIGAAEILRQSLPKWDVKAGTIDMYYWYYGTLAMFQMGGKYWDAWNKSMVAALVSTQETKGCERGSWSPACAWGSAGGRVYSTAINILSLEIYYRFSKILKNH